MKRCLTASVMLASLFVAAPADAAACGDIIVEDLILTTNVFGCTGDGLIVGADNITIDLAGKVLAGTDTAGSAGIRIAGFKNVRIIGNEAGGTGFVNDFEVGIMLSSGAEKNYIERVMAESNGNGVQLDAAKDNRITLTSVGNSTNNGFVIGNGSTKNRLIDNDSSINARFGFNIVESDGNSLSDNGAFQNGHAGINLLDAHKNSIHSNTTDNNGQVVLADGILLTESTRNDIAVNDATSNTDDGIGLIDSEKNKIYLNPLLSNDDAGIELEGESDKNKIKSNTITLSIDGIRAAATVSKLKLQKNTSNSNTDDGIDVAGFPVKITRNTTNNNTDLGISAPPEAKGRKNIATGNATDCVPVKLC